MSGDWCEPIPIPIKLGSDHYCEYEQEFGAKVSRGEEPGVVKMGDTVSVTELIGPDSREVEHVGVLCGAGYGPGGFLDWICLYDERRNSGWRVQVPCDGVFFSAGKEAR